MQAAGASNRPISLQPEGQRYGRAVCGVAALVNSRAIHCAPRLASHPAHTAARPLGDRKHVLSTAYLGWSFAAQQYVAQRAHAELAAQGVEVERVLVTPTPLNTVLWRVVAVTPTQYLEGFYAMADGGQPIRWTVHPRGSELIALYGSHPQVQRVARFSRGFWRLWQDPNGHIHVTDLRMGQEPAYSFDFDLGPAAEVAQGGGSVVRQPMRIDFAMALPALWRRMGGHGGGDGPFGVAP